MLVFLPIGALVTLVRFGFPRSSLIGFVEVLFLVVELVDLVRVTVESWAIQAEVRVTSEIEYTTANINISYRVLRSTVVNDIEYGRSMRHEKVARIGFIGLKIRQERALR